MTGEPSPTIRVVIADDHMVVRMGLRALLDAAGDVQVVAEASDGGEALFACAEHRPDVVIMDLSMAPMNGLEAMRQLQLRGNAPRILALTMHEEEDYLIPALEAGASGYILKAAASSDLLDAVRAVASGRTWVSATAAPVLARGWTRRSGQQELRAKYDRLSDREREVFINIAKGLSSPQIGELLHLSPKTVDTYKRRVADKLGVHDRSEFVQLALELQLLTPGP